MKWNSGAILVMSGLLGAGLLGGCGKEDDQPEHKIVKGRVSEINKETGEVGMIWHNKKGEVMELEGKLAQGAEILINGRTAELDDVLIDDEVEVIGSVSGEGTSRRLIAHKVSITRFEDTGDEPAGDADSEGEDQVGKSDTEPASE